MTISMISLGLVGSSLAIGGGIFAEAAPPPYQVGGYITSVAGLITAITMLIRAFQDSQETKVDIKTISAQLTASDEKAKIAVEAAEKLARELETFRQENKAFRLENVRLARDLGNQLRQSHVETRQELARTVPGPRPRVLIVDDNKATCDSFVRWLDRNGFEGDFALTIAEAETKLHPNLVYVFLDWNLPDGCGIELLTKLKRDKHVAKIIVITGNATDEVYEKSWHAFAEMTIAKPLEPKELDDLLIFMRSKIEAAPRPHVSDLDMPTYDLPLMPPSDSGPMPILKV